MERADDDRRDDHGRNASRPRLADVGVTAAAMRASRVAEEPAPEADGPTPAVEGYVFAFRRGAEPGRDLLVVLSPSRRFILFTERFAQDALFAYDLGGVYYLMRVRALARAIAETVEAGNYDRVLFVGTSKGAFAALMLARLCARLRPERTFRALAFSPQVRLDPANPALTFPSYARLRRLAQRRFALALALHRHGDAARLHEAPNVAATVFYGARNPIDAGEALRLAGPNVQMRPVEGSNHGSLVYLKMKGRPEASVRKWVERLYARDDAQGDLDLQSTRPADMNVFVQEILAASAAAPTLHEVVAAALAAEPPGRRFGAVWRLRAEARDLWALLRAAAWFVRRQPGLVFSRRRDKPYGARN